MNGVIYARYSCEGQREESIEGQLRECMSYAQRNGIAILNTYVDRAISGKNADNRPQFQQMIKDSAKKMFDVVLVWKLDRFARNRADSATYKCILKKRNVRVLSATEHISEGSEGILLESVLEGMAEYFSADLSEKVVRGLTENALKCKSNGGTIPTGYLVDENHKLAINPATAPIVLEVFTRYADGMTMKQLSDYLTEKGVRSAKGGKMTVSIVEYMLKNRRYIGEYRYREIVQEGGIPAIVSRELFDSVQERMQKNRRAPSRHKAEDDYLLTTKLFCGKCSATMVGECGTSRTGMTHRYYRCSTSKKKRACDKKTVKKEWIENLVVSKTMETLMNDTLMQDLSKRLFSLQQKENTTVPILKKQLAETQKAIENMLNAIQAGIFNESTKNRLDQLEEQKNQLEISMLQEQIQRPFLSKEQILFWLHKFRKMDMTDKTERQRLIDSFVNAIYLYDDKLVITFNYKDGTKTISLDEVNGSDLTGHGVPQTRINITFMRVLSFSNDYFFDYYCGFYKSHVLDSTALLCINLHPQPPLQLLTCLLPVLVKGMAVNIQRGADL